MTAWSLGGVLIIVIVLLVVIILIERRRVHEGIVISSHYRKLLIAGAGITAAGVAAMAAFYFLDVPFYIGVPLVAIGLSYLFAGFVYRHEWTKWVRSYMGLDDRRIRK